MRFPEGIVKWPISYYITCQGGQQAQGSRQTLLEPED